MAKTAPKKTKSPAAKKPVEPAPAHASGKTVIVALNRVQGIDYPMPDGRVVSINGNATGLRGQPTGVLPIGEFGLTEVREDDWLYIEKTWGETRLFKSGLIFASTKGENTEFQTNSLTGEILGVVTTTGGKAEFYYTDRETSEATVVTWLKGKAGIS